MSAYSLRLKARHATDTLVGVAFVLHWLVLTPIVFAAALPLIVAASFASPHLARKLYELTSRPVELSDAYVRELRRRVLLTD